jgi:AraC-like DNA-binding protein
MMAAVPHVHSVPARVQLEPCETIACLPHPRLRPYVVGYAGFRSGSGALVRHRVLPLNLVTVIIDFAGPCGLVTGPRSTFTVDGQTGWRHGVSVGLTPAGVFALLGLSMRELVGGTARLPDFLGHRDVELAERLGEAPNWPTRFALLDERLTAWLAGDQMTDGLVMDAWCRLQQSADRPRISALADELSVSRRYLELGFQRQIGLPPAAVARIARLAQTAAVTALQRLGQPDDIAAVVAFLASPDAQWITGQNVRATGGLLL